jgi:hypothetical protein
VPPVSDNHIVALLRRFVPPGGRSAVVNKYVYAPTTYYYLTRRARHLVSTVVTAEDRRLGHTVVVVPHHEDPLVSLHIANGVPTGPPRLLSRREWIDLYDVPIDRRRTACAGRFCR